MEKRYVCRVGIQGQIKWLEQRETGFFAAGLLGASGMLVCGSELRQGRPPIWQAALLWTMPLDGVQ